jgi:hypothetical protein
MTCPKDVPHEPRHRPPDEQLTALLTEWRDLCRRCLNEVEGFTRERPAASLAIAFFAGSFIVSFFRRH